MLYILYGSGADFLGGYFSTYYINLSIFLAFAASYPDMELLLYFILPIKIKWMGLVYGVYILYQLATGNPASRIVVISSLLNFVVFFLSSRNLKPYTPKEQVRKAKFRQQTRPHMTYANGAKHRCAVCGRTELDDSSLEFRFCSKCNGKGKIMYTQQSFFGTVQNVQTCPDCNGTGQVIKEKCPDCYGTGYISSKKTIEVSIPAGIDNGQCVRIQGKGEPGVNGGQRGDLLVAVMISADPEFERDGYNVFSNVKISYPTAVLGGEIKVRTVDGEVLYDVKPGTDSGSRVRLKGKGMPTVRNSAVRGDHYITLIVDIPKKLSAEQKDALLEYDKTLTGEERTHKKRGFFK